MPRLGSLAIRNVIRSTFVELIAHSNRIMGGKTGESTICEFLCGCGEEYVWLFSSYHDSAAVGPEKKKRIVLWSVVTSSG